ncbi:MAG: glucose-6-phosphate isomerase [Gammaproteobacteria bacterium]|nr:glucose-6-phosphate isomerase [Gammaproteobacteria bacterium]
MAESALSPGFPTDLPSWQALEDHYRDDMQSKQISDLFARNQQRFAGYSLEAGELFLDYSKNIVNAKTRSLLLRLANEVGVPEAIEAMFAGEPINSTEVRSVLHVALRSKMSDEIALDVPGVGEIWEVLERMTGFVNGVHGGEIRGVTGRRLTDVVNIGIGGSDLGLVMASRALRHYWQPGMNFHSVSNVDGTQLVDLTEQLDPEETLFVICSKTFTTQETMANANAASDWISKRLGGDAVGHHFAAASTNHEAMDLFGINPEYRFEFWNWVGGRFSIWSAVGLSLALVIGVDRFWAMLAGARRMDQHFRSAPIEENMPMLLALIGIWYNNFFGAESQAILPYDNRLDRFPAFLQQLQMESSGKSVRGDGQPVRCKTGAVIWGEAGSNAQHSFYQLLHQGTRFVPVDFVLPLESSGGSQSQHDLAIADCLAQSEALMDGYEPESVDEPYRRHPGNRPSNIIVLPRLTPSSLGQLIALYEHKVFVEGVIWGINSFDQFGVELGKRLGQSIYPAVADASLYEGENDSTKGLLARIREFK